MKKLLLMIAMLAAFALPFTATADAQSGGQTTFDHGETMVLWGPGLVPGNAEDDDPTNDWVTGELVTSDRSLDPWEPPIQYVIRHADEVTAVANAHNPSQVCGTDWS